LHFFSPVELKINHQHIGFLEVPRGPVMMASCPHRESLSRGIRILLPTIFLSRAWCSSSSVSRSILSLSGRSELSLLISIMHSSAVMSRGLFLVQGAFFGDDILTEDTTTAMEVLFTSAGALRFRASDRASEGPWRARRPGKRRLCRCSNCIVLLLE